MRSKLAILFSLQVPKNNLGILPKDFGKNDSMDSTK